TSRIEVKFPIPSEPMLVVYWGRWADARGGVGRFSRTCVARVEGWTQRRPDALPGGEEAPRIETKIVYVQVERLPPARLTDATSQRRALPEAPRRRVKAIEMHPVTEAA